MRSAVRICPAAPKKQSPRWGGCFFAWYGQIRIMSAQAMGPVHRPVQTLANTLIFSSRLTEGKKKCRRICPAALFRTARSGGKAHPYRGMRSFFPVRRRYFFLLPVQKKETKKTTPGRGRFRFLPLPGPTLIETTGRGPAGPLLGIPPGRRDHSP